jgi:hypothetical protein
MDGLSTGRVVLGSADPAVPPVIQLNYLEHPFDTRVMIEAIKKILAFLNRSGLPIAQLPVGLKSAVESDLEVRP